MFQYSEVLRKVPFLASLDERETRFIADRLELETFKADDRICRAGDPGDRMYIIASGNAEVAVGSGLSDREFVIAKLGSGDYFGEMALLTGEPRSASVTTTEPSQLYVLTKSDSAMKSLSAP